MKIVIITSNEHIPGEAQMIAAALNMGVWRIHIRKIGWSEAEHRELLEAIPAGHRSRLTLHDNFHLAAEYGIGGVQLNGRNGTLPEGFEGSISRSCHFMAEVAEHAHLDYVTLSPIYDSISKPGYKSNFATADLCGEKPRVIAMGGVRPENILSLWQMGFGGAALLGYIWEQQELFSLRVSRALAAARWCENFKLQYITHRTAERNDIAGARLALQGGCRWVQLRMKGASDEEVLSVASELRKLCDEYSATMLLDDKVELVKAAGADGVHLGKDDMAPSEARKLLGGGYIIGGTANTLDDIDRLVSQGVDYIGMGPYRYTQTKSKLSPIIGAEGYCRAREHSLERGYSVPIVAIGGIGKDDIGEIITSGASGIALSGTILSAADPRTTTEEIINEIEKWID